MSQIRPLVTCAPCVPTRVKKPDRKALRDGPAPFAHHAGKFRDLDEEEGRAEHEGEGGEDQKTARLPPFGGQRSEPAGVAREQQAHGLDKDIAEIEQLGAGRSAGGVARQHRVGREQPREHDDVAEEEDPEPVRDDGTRRGRPAAASPAHELGGGGTVSIVAIVMPAARGPAGPVPFAQFRRPRFRARDPRSSRTPGP